MTYDGYGRLKTQHRPEQDANTYTTYNYYSDDRIQQVVDARGATVNYSYDNRGLTTQVSTTSPNPSVIPVTPTVTYAYDNLGNRTQMTDGMGNVTYEYNQLSQLMAETRSFTDSLPNAPMANNSFRLQYSYSFSGQLKSITDPYGQQINYSHDKVGRLNSVTGSSFGGVTNYAANPQYRAWGGMKHFEYGNGLYQDTTFNNRLQADSFKIFLSTDTTKRVFDKQYQYNGDGNLKFIAELTDPVNKRYDRSYTYDHAGRVVNANTGIEASGGTVSNPSTYNYMPYRQSYTFDAFGNMSQKVGRMWRNTWNSHASFINNRTSNITYDADGNEVYVNQGQSNWQYNASGQMNKTWKVSNYETELGLDGEGLEIRRANREWDSVNNVWEAWRVSYFIRSSVLKQIVSEASFDGKKRRSNVFGSGGSTFAYQTIQYDGTQNVIWELADESRNSTRTIALGSVISGNGTGSGTELDPLGNNVGTSVPEDQIYRVRADSPSSNTVADTQSQCTLGGLTGPCSIVEGLTDGRTFASHFPNLPFEMKGRTPRNENNPLIRNNEIISSVTGDSGTFSRALIHYQEGRFETLNLNSNYLNYLVGGQSEQKLIKLNKEQVAELRNQLKAALDPTQSPNGKLCDEFLKEVIKNLPGKVKAGKSILDVFEKYANSKRGFYYNRDSVFGQNISSALSKNPEIRLDFKYLKNFGKFDGFGYPVGPETLVLELIHEMLHGAGRGLNDPENKGRYDHDEMANAMIKAGAKFRLSSELEGIYKKSEDILRQACKGFKGWNTDDTSLDVLIK